MPDSGATHTRPRVIGHRGAPGYRPEHTESAYRLAFEMGVDAVEPDLVVTRDGVLVIRHENEISGTTDVAEHPEFADRRTSKVVDEVELTGWFTEDFTWEELSTLRSRERIPEFRPENTRYDGAEPMLRLRDLLAIVDDESRARGREFGIVIEIKHAHFLRTQGFDLAELLLAELSRSEWIHRTDRLTVESFELGVLDQLRDAGFGVDLVFLMESRGAPADEVALACKAANSYEWYRSDAGLDSLVGRVAGISLAKRDLLRRNMAGKLIGVADIVDRAHARGLTVFTWTLRPENAFLDPKFREPKFGRSDFGDWREEWKLILSTGLDGVFVDHPALFAELRSSS